MSPRILIMSDFVSVHWLTAPLVSHVYRCHVAVERRQSCYKCETAVQARKFDPNPYQKTFKRSPFKWNFAKHTDWLGKTEENSVPMCLQWLFRTHLASWGQHLCRWRSSHMQPPIWFNFLAGKLLLRVLISCLNVKVVMLPVLGGLLWCNWHKMVNFKVHLCWKVYSVSCWGDAAKACIKDRGITGALNLAWRVKCS